MLRYEAIKEVAIVGAAHFLLGQYSAEESPLVALSGSRRASEDQHPAAAYGRCGVYSKTRNRRSRSGWRSSSSLRGAMRTGSGFRGLR